MRVPPDLPLVTILANAGCPHCVHATDMLTDWCCEQGLAVAGIDVLHHPDAAARWNLEGSPAVVVERGGTAHVFAGFPTHDEFARLTHR